MTETVEFSEELSWGMVEAASSSECQYTLLQHVALHPEDNNLQLKNRFI